MHEALAHARYTGYPGHAMGHHHGGDHHGHGGHQGFCHSCCHPRTKCGCGCMQCRKEAKELLVKAAGRTPGVGGVVGGVAGYRSGTDADVFERDEKLKEMSARAAFVGTRAKEFADLARGEGAALALGTGSAFIGGGCCVHLSIEYTPTTPTAASMAIVLVDDSEGTILAWAKTEKAGTGYQIRECIITTKPGADLNVLVVNMTARVRWCEIFSC